MANFKRKKPKLRTVHRPKHWRSWPAWWDILHHRRPHRRDTAVALIQLRKGADPDNLSWPLPKKPHNYYW